MKTLFKTFVATVLLMLSTLNLSFAESGNETANPSKKERTILSLECTRPGYTVFHITNEWAAQGNLMHNYSTARVSCSASFQDIFNETATRVCYGAWDWDFDRVTGKTLETMAQVTVINDGKDITAKTTTSASYGSRPISMKCKVETIKTTLGE